MQRPWGRNRLCGLKGLEGSSASGAEWVGGCWPLGMVGRSAGAAGMVGGWTVEMLRSFEQRNDMTQCSFQKLPWLLGGKEYNGEKGGRGELGRGWQGRGSAELEKSGGVRRKRGD